MTGDGGRDLLKACCPRCGAMTGQRCSTLHAGTGSIVECHRERRCDPTTLIAQGYIKYALVDRAGQHPIFLWRPPTQRPATREGYHDRDRDSPP